MSLRCSPFTITGSYDEQNHEHELEQRDKNAPVDDVRQEGFDECVRARKGGK